jgi:hypothetical protein
MHSACIPESPLVYRIVVLRSENMCRGAVAKLWNRMASVSVHYGKVVPWTHPTCRLRFFGLVHLRPVCIPANYVAME